MQIKLGIGLLAVLLALGVFAQGAMGSISRPLAEQVEQAAAYTRAGRWDYACREFDRAKTGWESAWRKTAALADHAPMEDIDALFAQGAAAAEDFREGEFLQSAAELSVRLKAMADAHTFSWWNLM